MKHYRTARALPLLLALAPGVIEQTRSDLTYLQRVLKPLEISVPAPSAAK